MKTRVFKSVGESVRFQDPKCALSKRGSHASARACAGDGERERERERESERERELDR